MTNYYEFDKLLKIAAQNPEYNLALRLLPGDKFYVLELTGPNSCEITIRLNDGLSGVTLNNAAEHIIAYYNYHWIKEDAEKRGLK